MNICPKTTPGEVSKKISRQTEYDVVVIGGAFSGSSSAILLKRRFPDLRVLIIEKSEEFDRKVGESTSEVAGCFLTRVLKIGNFLARDHVAKHGLRMWFHRENDNMPGDSTEVGPAFQARLPTFQLNRITLDTRLLNEAQKLGCALVRPANIKNLDLGGYGNNTITYKDSQGEMRSISSGWVIDASGKAALIARKKETYRKNTDAHPVSAMWTRFKNVKDLDSTEAIEKMPNLCTCVKTQRSFATNHLMGFGWWSWIIPLNNGEVSAGVTWDSRLFTPPKEGNMAERVKEHLIKHPVGRVMFENAETVSKDNKYYKGLSYYSEEVAGDGWVIVGDAAGFMDPLYSQGLDFCAHTIYSSYSLIRKQLMGECVSEDIPMKNSAYLKSYFDWFNAIYKDKYWYIGDAELMYIAFLLDISTYFIGPVRLVYEMEDEEFSKMPYAGPVGEFFAKFMALYNRRLVTLAKKKIQRGDYGAKNLNESFIISKAFTPGPATLKHMVNGIKRWIKAEIKYCFTKPTEQTVTPSPSTPMPSRPEAWDYQQA